ncbi:MAG TPA: NADPH-dependent glutamate synthase [Deltaproteobacteria bacterium]|nr:NADPH-dependent glutamate synthase [Deltaproteobacteria bacterium]HPR52111.1 NADPH-dependent glutamate synthase [Deltaproteobacteria bacterium]
MEMKERLKIPRQPMPEQDPKVRARNFDEVPLGFTPEMAKLEALRCIQCKNPACVDGCPVEVDIPGFIALVAEGDFIGAAKKIKSTNALPAVCGRVCPQEVQCEIQCVRGKKAEPVAIGRLERFVADFERAAGEVSIPEKPAPTGKKIAVVGSGPAGLTVAGDMVQLGHDVTMFEALHAAGGVLVYGIPEFRLPKAIVAAEVDYLKKLGVKLETSSVIGKVATVDDLFEEGYDAIFLGTGAGAPSFMKIPGENLNGIYSANEYLTRSNLMKAYRFPEYDTPIVRGKNVAVIGGGNVAMDAARTAMRLGADNVYLVYRRSRQEMPARIEEIHHAEEEGIQLNLLTTPIKYIGNDKGWVTSMECLRMELGEPDDSGRRRPVPIEGSEFTWDVDAVVVAIGSGANPLVQETTPGLDTNKWNNIVADEETGQTSREGVFAGGDIVTGAATVILAMGAGRKAARAMHEYVMSK